MQNGEIFEIRPFALDSLAALFLSTGQQLPIRSELRQSSTNNYELCRAPVVFGSANDNLPPRFPESAGYSIGALQDSESVWWRQTPRIFQIVCQLADDVSLKRDVTMELRKKRISLEIAGVPVVVGELPHSIKTAECDWYTEDELPGFPEDHRYLIIDLAKEEPFVDWPAPLMDDSDNAEKSEKRLVIGGGQQAQKECSAQQLATFQALKKIPGTGRADVYGRPASSDSETVVDWYFLGKVAADFGIDDSAALAAQEILVKQHARLFLPSVFGECHLDSDIRLAVAPGESELQMAQLPDKPLTMYDGLPEGQEMPMAESVGFKFEARNPAQIDRPDLIFRIKRAADGLALPEDLRPPPLVVSTAPPPPAASAASPAEA